MVNLDGSASKTSLEFLYIYHCETDLESFNYCNPQIMLPNLGTFLRNLKDALPRIINRKLRMDIL